MVSGNDNEPAQVSAADEKPNPVNVNVNVRANLNGAAAATRPYTYTGRSRLSRVTSSTYTSVTDDLGPRIEVRVGEAVLLGSLLDAVIDALRAKAANER